MATLKQKKVAKAIIDNIHSPETKTAGEILENVGYSEGITLNPQVVLQSTGVKAELYRLGFSEENAKTVVGEILQFGDEDKDRLKAAEIIFKVFGSFAAEKHVTLNIDAESTEHTRELGNRLVRLLRRGDQPSV